MHKLKITYKRIDEIAPYARNARTHSVEQIEQIKASIKEFGMCTPIGLHKGVIVYGHARIESLKQLGETEAPTVDLSHLTAAQKKAYILADNKLALNAGYDIEMLTVELQDLVTDEFDVSLIGFSPEELERTMGTDPENEEQGGAGESACVSIKGDIWVLGEHELKCGKSGLGSADDIVKYFQSATGKQAFHKKTKDTFADTESARGVM